MGDEVCSRLQDAERNNSCFVAEIMPSYQGHTNTRNEHTANYWRCCVLLHVVVVIFCACKSFETTYRIQGKWY